MPEGRPEPPDPAQQHHRDQDGQQQPADEARHVGGLLAQPERVDLLDLRVVETSALADDHLALEDLDPNVLDAIRRRGRAPVRCCSGLNDEFGTRSGLISSAASIRSASSRPPAIRPDRPVLASATWVSRSSVRSVASRTRAASVRTAAHRAASSPISVFVRGLPGARGRRSRAAAARSSVPRSAANVVSMRCTRRSKASCCSSAIAIAFSLVKSYCGSTAARAAARASVVWTDADEIDGPGRDDVAWRKLTRVHLEGLVGQDVRPEDGGHRHDQDQRRDHETPCVTAGESSQMRARAVSIGSRSGPSARGRRGPRGRRPRAPGRRAR